jgi:hypothetical protein
MLRSMVVAENLARSFSTISRLAAEKTADRMASESPVISIPVAPSGDC